jgi:hypothetical protein
LKLKYIPITPSSLRQLIQIYIPKTPSVRRDVLLDRDDSCDVEVTVVRHPSAWGIFSNSLSSSLGRVVVVADSAIFQRHPSGVRRGVFLDW